MWTCRDKLPIPVQLCYAIAVAHATKSSGKMATYPVHHFDHGQVEADAKEAVKAESWADAIRHDRFVVLPRKMD